MIRVYILLASIAFGTSCFSVADNAFFIQRGMSLLDLAILAAIFNVVVSLVELPLSVTFERSSLKAGAAIGLILSVLSFCVYFVGYDFATIATAQFIAAIAVAARSGTVDALAINFTSARSQASLALLFARIGYVTGIASLLGGMIGFALFRVNEGLIWLASSLSYSVGIVSVLWLKYSSKSEKRSSSIREYFLDIKSVFQKRITYIKIITDVSPIGITTYWQPIFDGTNSYGLLIGFLVMTMAVSLASFLFQRRPVDYSRVPLVIAGCFISTFTLGWLSGLWPLLLGLLVHVMLQVALAIIVGSAFHSTIKDEVRAGSVSAISLASSAVGAISVLGLGTIASHFGAQEAIAISSVMYAILAFIFFIPFGPSFKGD
jgi:hypothetical protein